MESAQAPIDTSEMESDRLARKSERRRRKGTVYQLVACFVANTSVLGPAMALGYSAVALGPLGSPKSEIKATANELSWIASITAIATPIGCVLSSITMLRGRRFGVMSTSITSIIGWLVIYLAPDVGHILVGRAISGVAMGLASVPATVYAAEIASPKLRGVVVTWTSVGIAIGILIVYTFGYILQTNWRMVALLCGIFPVTSIILVLIKMPESPVWLRSVGRTWEAEEIFNKFNGYKKGETPFDINEELELPVLENGGRDFKSRGALCTRENLKPFLIMLGFFFFQQFSGIFVVIYYAVDFTLEAGVRMDGHLAAILIGITRLLGTFAVSYVSRKFGRRKPSICSGIGMTIFMGILTIYSWTSNRGYVINDRGIIPALSILMYIFTSTMGFLVLPFAMIGELYPTRVKDVFSGLTTCFAYIFSFFVLKIYPDMFIAFNKHGMFLFYGTMSFLGTIFVAFFLPETKGKTLQEIEDLFKKSQFKKTKKSNVERSELDKETEKDEDKKILTSELKVITTPEEVNV